ncbi:serine hydrolase domain-containing protein [Martelella limonii]|uniref:serine hydrolase domain-containing protein n=1 Tax=Martelella limonii TaxID=1647649 RepID=UPI0015800211|nr:serine hydrolase domain-containing protein [Martelella limonii]
MEISQRIDAVIDRAIDDARIVGTVVLVWREGTPVYERAAGHADREAGKPTALDTIFRYASVTKPFVAAAALAMIDAGKFSLDDHVGDLLPWFHPPGPDGRQAQITIRQLLTHTAGLNYRPGAGILPAHEAMTVGIEDSDLSLEENFSRHNAVPLDYKPGTAWEYSIAIDILGAVLAEVEGASVEETLKRYLLAPLGIRDTTFHVADAERLAVPYFNADPIPQPMGEPQRVAFEPDRVYTFSPARIFNRRAFQGGGGGMAGTAGDVMRLLEMVRRGGEGILKPETARAALTNQIGDLSVRPGVRFGFLGAVTENAVLDNSPLPDGAVSWGGVYGNRWCLDPKTGTVAVAMTNTAPEGCDGAFPSDILRAVFEA